MPMALAALKLAARIGQDPVGRTISIIMVVVHSGQEEPELAVWHCAEFALCGPGVTATVPLLFHLQPPVLLSEI